MSINLLLTVYAFILVYKFITTAMKLIFPQLIQTNGEKYFTIYPISLLYVKINSYYLISR